MARTRRTELTHPTLHVYSRGADRQDIFSSDHDRHLFEHLLGDLPERFGVSIHAVALMHNHVHLIVDRTDGELSAAMQHLFGRYARSYNEHNGRSGPLFTGRFGVAEITSDEQLVQCSRYVHLNPLEFVPLDAITSYRWSSLGVYAGRRTGPTWLDTSLVPRALHRSDDDYVRFVLTPQPGDHCGRPLQPWTTLTLHCVDDAVQRVAGGRPAVSRRGRGDVARDLAIAAAVELRVRDTASIAAHHGMTSAVSVRTTARRVRVRCAQDDDLAARLRRIVSDLRARSARAGLSIELDEAS